MMDVASKRLHHQYDRFAGLASPVASTCTSQCTSDTEDECKSARAVQFFQCPKPYRQPLEPVPKKLRCPTPPVKQIAFSLESEEDDDYCSESDSDSDEADESTDEHEAHIDRFRRSDSDSDDSSEVFYCE